jgi:hypothetical protein
MDQTTLVETEREVVISWRPLAFGRTSAWATSSG